MGSSTLRLVLASILSILAAVVPVSAQCRDETAPLSLTLTLQGARALDDPEGCCGGSPELFVKVLVNGVLTCTLGPTGSSFPLEGPQLEGHAPKNSLNAFLPTREITADRAVAEWVVRAPQGTRLALTARAERAGVVRAEVSLD